MIDQLTTLVRQLTISQRIGIVFGALLSVLLLVGLVMWAGQPQMQPAFNDLSTSDASTITSALDGAGIPYQLANGGTTIEVPSSQVAQARLAAGSAGFSSDGTTGWELFDSQSWGASEFDQDVAYQRAIQGELTRQIEGLQGVKDANVTIVTQSKGVLTTEDRPASASVYLKMAGGQTPPASLVQGIQGLVAGAVAGLTTSNVTVVDSDGRVVGGPDDASSGLLTIQGTVEREVEAKVQAYLATILGAGKSSVAVTADLDLDKVAKTVKSYETGNGNPASSVDYSREVVGQGAGNGASGIPGTASNVVPIYPAASPAASPGASGNPDYLKEHTTLNYANTETVSQIVQTPGSIKRLSVAVLVDGDALTASGMATEVLKTGIIAAVGASTAAVPDGRGDVVELAPAKFAPTIAATAPGPDITGIIGDAAPTAGGIALALVLLLLVWRNLRALRGRAEDMQLATSRSSQPQLPTGELAYAGAHVGGPGFFEASVPEIPAPSSPQAKIQERIRLMAEDQPDDLANLVATWLHEDDKARRR